VKENQSALLGVAVGILVLRFVDVLWWIEPAFAHSGPRFYWLLDVAAFVGLGGLWMWWFIGLLRYTSLEPLHDPNQCETEGGHA
jgi:hypothetical protein